MRAFSFSLMSLKLERASIKFLLLRNTNKFMANSKESSEKTPQRRRVRLLAGRVASTGGAVMGARDAEARRGRKATPCAVSGA